jgi:hypothetical protein
MIPSQQVVMCLVPTQPHALKPTKPPIKYTAGTHFLLVKLPDHVADHWPPHSANGGTDLHFVRCATNRPHS